MKKTYKYFFLNIFIVLININLFAQTPLDKKGAWGINFGLNYYYPVISDYSYHSMSIGEFGYPDVEEQYYINLFGKFGEHIEISKIINLYKIDEKKSLNLIIGSSFNQKKASLEYHGNRIENGNVFIKNGKEIIEKKYPSLDIKFSNVSNSNNNKYGILNAISYRIDFTYTPNRFNVKDLFWFQQHHLTYSLGFIYNFKNNNNITFYLNQSICDLKKHDKYFPDYSIIGPFDLKKEYFNLFEFGVVYYLKIQLKNK